MAPVTTQTTDSATHSDVSTGSNDSSLGEKALDRPPKEAAVTPAAPGTRRFREMNRVLWVVLIASVVSAPFLFGFDLIVVGSIQPQIVATLGQENKLPWISVSYALAGASTTLLWARLYGVFNIKVVFIVSLILFEVGTVLSGAATSMNMLIGGRSLSGVGAIGAYAGAMTVLSVVTTIQQRPLYISFVTISYGLSTILAPIIGGALADSRATWRWAFYLNVCIAGLFTPAYLTMLPSTCFLPSKTPWKQRILRLDPVGNVLWAGASTSLIMAISCGGTIWAWGSGQSIAVFVVAGALWCVFGVQQYPPLLVAEEARILPALLFRSAEVANLFLQSAGSSSVALLPVFLIPIYFSFVRGASALQASLYLLPLVVLRSVFILVNGAMMRRYGYTMPWFVAGAVLCVAGSAPFLAVSPETPTAHIIGWTVLMGAGVGMYNQAPFAVAQARTTPADAPSAIALITTGQVGASAAALAVSNAVFVNRANALIAAAVPPGQYKAIGDAILRGAQQGVLDGLSESQRAAVVQSIVDALNKAWIPVVIAAGVSLILAPFLKRDRLFQ